MCDNSEELFLLKCIFLCCYYMYSSPGYTCNNNMSIKLDNFGKKNNKCSPRHCRPLLLKNLGRGSSFNVNYQNCCKKNMSKPMGQSRQDLVAMFIEWSFFVVEWVVLRAFSSMLMDLLNLFNCC
jgi:hypothetical protein